MANELTLSVSIAYQKNRVSFSDAISSLLASVAGNGIEAQTYTVPTTAGGTALPLGGVSAAGGWLFGINTDGTNYMTILSAVSGTTFAKLLAGEPILIRLPPGMTAPAVLANTATVAFRYFIADL